MKKFTAESGPEGQNVVVHVDANETLQAFVARVAAMYNASVVSRRSPHGDQKSNARLNNGTPTWYPSFGHGAFSWDWTVD